MSDGRISRIFFMFHAGCVVVLHGFIKKSQKTPDVELALARRRMKAVKA
ncbi:MAG: type II toxin-antitoxin system RelE/ParE family toxin [Rhizomicrobium sp.]